MTEKITDQVIQSLSPREQILRRPNMFIGSVSMETITRFIAGQHREMTYIPGLVKCIDEVIDNSVDEAIRTGYKFANRISVEIDGRRVIVEDNGRGIPQAPVKVQSGELLPGPVATWTQTATGGNFEDDKNRKTMGMNGVGSTLANFFSELFIGETCDGKNKITVHCTDNGSTTNHKTVKSTKKGTKVTFIPDFDNHFQGSTLSGDVLEIVRDRLNTLSVIHPDIQFTFNGKRVHSTFKQYAKSFSENSMIIEGDNYSIAVLNSGDHGFLHETYINGLHLEDGGSHVNYLVDGLCDELIPMIKRKHKIEVQKPRIKETLCVVMIIRDMVDMKFDSQTKVKLTNTNGEIKSHLGIDFNKCAKTALGKHESDLIMPAIESTLIRKQAAEKAAETRAEKATKQANVLKHIKATNAGTGKPCTLFLTEGDSAIGYLLKVRTPAIHGGFPLRGKPLNTWKLANSKILANEEMANILNITGLSLSSKSIHGLQYNDIGIMVDADHDGVGDILPLLLCFFSRWPELFAQGKIKFIKTPVYIAEKGKDAKWFYTVEEFREHESTLKGYTVRHIKGLGSLRQNEYKRVIDEMHCDVIGLDANYKELLEMMFGKNSDQRKEWLDAQQ